MSDTHTEFEKWWQDVGRFEDHNGATMKEATEQAYQAATSQQAERIAQQDEIIEQQLRTITALNDALGGEGSLTTDNLVRVGRLETEIDELRTKNAHLELALKVKDEALYDAIEMVGHVDNIKRLHTALCVQPSQEALDEFRDRIYIELANEARENGNNILSDQFMSKCKTELILG